MLFLPDTTRLHSSSDPSHNRHGSLGNRAASTPDISTSTYQVPTNGVNGNTFENTIDNVRFSFELIRLLPKCQQVEILFSTLYQDITPGANESNNGSKANELLFELLLSNMREIHDSEITLSAKDNSLIPPLIHERPRDPKLYKCPLADPRLPNLTFKNSSKSEAVFAKLKCFVKATANNSVVITLLPASYDDLKTLVLPSTTKTDDFSDVSVQIVNGDSSNSERQTSLDDNQETNHNESNESAESNENSSPNKGDSESNSNQSSPTLSSSKNELSSYLGSITLPIYVYKCSFSSLSDQLVYFVSEKKKEDVYINSSLQMQYNANEDDKGSDSFNQQQAPQINDTKHPLEMNSENNNNNNQFGNNKVSLKAFCDSIESVYWNSFIHAFYHAMQLNYKVHKRDLSTIVEGLFDEPPPENDIAKYLRCICRHPEYIPQQDDIFNEQLMRKGKRVFERNVVKHYVKAICKSVNYARKDHLWQGIVPTSSSNSPDFSSTATLTYDEFVELLSLVPQVKLEQYDPFLRPFASKSIDFYNGLKKYLVKKYGKSQKIFMSPDKRLVRMVSLKFLLLMRFKRLMSDKLARFVRDFETSF